MSETPTGAGTAEVPAVRLTGIAKRFPGVVANHDVAVDHPAGHRARPRRARTAPASPP